jgi:23S rRNA-/tRNA-specific pseudouridylate synthase
MRERLSDAFYRHETNKVYHAIVLGKPKDGAYVHYAKKDADAAFMRLCRESDPDALKMELAVRVLETKRELSLVEIRLFTGRTHQIRVQMAAIGCPVLGDDKYGDRDANKRYKRRRQCLLAKRLTVFDRTFESTKELTLNDFREEKR